MGKTHRSVLESGIVFRDGVPLEEELEGCDGTAAGFGRDGEGVDG